MARVSNASRYSMREWSAMREEESSIVHSVGTSAATCAAEAPAPRGPRRRWYTLPGTKKYGASSSSAVAASSLSSVSFPVAAPAGALSSLFLTNMRRYSPYLTLPTLRVTCPADAGVLPVLAAPVVALDLLKAPPRPENFLVRAAAAVASFPLPPPLPPPPLFASPTSSVVLISLPLPLPALPPPPSSTPLPSPSPPSAAPTGRRCAATALATRPAPPLMSVTPPLTASLACAATELSDTFAAAAACPARLLAKSAAAMSRHWMASKRHRSSSTFCSDARDTTSWWSTTETR
mmetsp:Transcript_17379/g.42966  ORF Transcript_17379/g.42966 Transcript_17379/m.42966 type:complete len:292 (+) Transcript_17379:291-1166(+)